MIKSILIIIGLFTVIYYLSQITLGFLAVSALTGRGFIDTLSFIFG